MDAAVRPATMDDLGGVTTVLADAFADDPLMSWAFPDDRTRSMRLAALFGFMAGEGYIPRGAATMVPGPDAAALWLAPGATLDEEFWEQRGGTFVAALDGDVERLSHVADLMTAHHPHDREHWYLLAIGVSPSRQGGRLGSALLAHTLAQSDADGAAAYLEATSPRSRALYERHGFEVTGELVVDDSPPIWPMWREPVAVPA